MYRDVPGVTSVLVGLHRIGLMGLRSALEEVAGSGLTDRDAIVDRLTESVLKENYVPDPRSEDFRTALWREYLRYKGEDFSDFYTEVAVTVRGEPGAEREQFVKMLCSILAEFELKPVVTFSASEQEGRHPQLVIDGETIVRGLQNRSSFRTAVSKSITDW
jgi:hypothetical protein